MRISHKHRFVFLAMPRTASTTVRVILDPYSDIKGVHISEITDEFPFYNHISSIELKNIFDKRGWDWYDYKKFCMIRNPYDRVVSLYHHHLKMMAKRSEERLAIGNLLKKCKNIIKPETFRKYVMSINPKRRLQTSLKAFVCDENNNFLVDNILMFESLRENLPKYFHSLGIQITAENIPHLNATEDRLGYRDYYDQDTKKKVTDLYAYEISRFGYRF